MGNISRLKQMAQTMNPHTLLSQMANTNPDLANVLKATNGDYEKAFYELAKQKGVNTDEFLSNLKNLM